MPRSASFWLLLAATVAIGYFFFQIIRPFVIVILIAVVLAMLFAPVHHWLTKRLGGHQRIAAFLTTALILLLVLVPVTATLMMAGAQVLELGNEAVKLLEKPAGASMQPAMEQLERTPVVGRVNALYQRLPEGRRQEIREAVAKMTRGVTDELYEKTRGFLSDLFTFLVSLAIMILTLYYLMADHDPFTRELRRMLPLALREERELNENFYAVCRGVVLGTVVAGAVQAILAGVAFFTLGVPQAWLLMVLTMFASFIPFVGATAVYIPVSGWLVWQGHYAGAIGLLIYGGAIVSTSDNLVRAHVVGHEARLHPLVALVTALGALKLIGLWGIFVGPIVAAFLHSLVNILRARMHREATAEKVPLPSPFLPRREKSGGSGTSRGDSQQTKHVEPAVPPADRICPKPSRPPVHPGAAENPIP